MFNAFWFPFFSFSWCISSFLVVSNSRLIFFSPFSFLFFFYTNIELKRSIKKYGTVARMVRCIIFYRFNHFDCTFLGKQMTKIKIKKKKLFTLHFNIVCSVELLFRVSTKFLEYKKRRVKKTRKLNENRRSARKIQRQTNRWKRTL